MEQLSPADSLDPPDAARRPASIRASIAAIARLASGSAGAQCIQLIGTLVLTRLLAPEVFGDMAVFLGYGIVLVGVAGLKLEQAIQLQADEKESRAFAAAALILAAPIGFGVALLLAGTAKLGWVPGGAFWTLPLALALGAYAWLGVAINTATAWHVRDGNVRDVVKLRWRTAAAIALFQITGAAAGLGLAGQVIGAVAGPLVALAITERHLVRRYRSSRGAVRGLRLAMERWKRWREPSINLVLASLGGTAAWQVPPLFLHHFWGAEAAGFYALAYRLSTAPLTISHSAISQVAYRETVIRIQSGRELATYMRRATAMLFVASAAGAIIAAALAPHAIPLLFDSRWEPLIALVPWMMLPFAFRMTGSVLSLFTQTGHTGWLLGWQVAFLCAHAGTFFIAHHASWTLLNTIIAAAALQVAFYLLMIAANLHLATKTVRQ